MTPVTSGQALTKDLWNTMVADLSDLDSRWSRAGSNLAFTGGNVGIGTTNPGAKLEVNGVVTASNINQAPFISTSNRSSPYLNTNTSTWQYTGTSVTFTVPSGPNRKYRIGSRVMAAGQTSGNYMVSTVSNSSSTVSWLPIWIWNTHEYTADGAWHSTFQEGYMDLAPGTYTYYLIVWSAANYLMSYHNDTGYTNIMVWPM